jgi:glycosyltransferase involved in cell wall biosynthesis
MTSHLSFVLPVHNDAATIEGIARRIVERLTSSPGSQLMLVENASTDNSAAVARRLAGTLTNAAVEVVALSSGKGIGRAWRRAIPLTTGDLVVLTGSDLPFGFSDLDAAMRMEPVPALSIGSKAHRDSVVEVMPTRKLMSMVFRLVRGLVLGLWQGDTQGSLLIEGPLLRRLAPDLRCTDYLIATEIVARAVAVGVTPVEVPIAYPKPDRPSNVAPLADSLRMLVGLVRLRREVGSSRRFAQRANRPVAR